ncbi:MAG TPA: alpha-1,2-fucosyltransferase [Candidatus Paceibacterota bacterium]|nr:alpha-1,2-fucosyltransferase [Candidatus Paceibacterota bacterium]
MVTVFLRGGLGNQMFQYAAALAVAKRNGTDVVVDTVHIQDRLPRPHFTYRTFDLADVFLLDPPLTALSKVSRRVPIPGVWLGADLFAMNAAEFFGRRRIIYEDERKELDRAVFEAKDNSILYGRWEDERYFPESGKEVRASFRFRHSLAGEAAALERDICAGNSVSLHVRRGDRASVGVVTKLMGTTNASYYKNAVEHVAKAVSSPKFFVFSDDIEWCKKNIVLDSPAVFVPASAAGPKGEFHLHLMSLCRHNIIANSTFSWWGAWLNENPGKIVVGPKEWSASATASGKRVIPSSWVAL